MKGLSSAFILVAALFLVADVALWHAVLRPTGAAAAIHFLDVGQGDSELLILPGNKKIMTDAGAPEGRVVDALERVLPFADRSIDLLLVTHPQLDHYGGFADVLHRYRVGALLISGRNADGASPQWQEMLAAARDRGVPVVRLQAGDSIRTGAARISLISPDNDDLQSAELNDTCLVELVQAPPLRALLTGDIDARLEEKLAAKFDIRADILKVAHHGSKYSSSPLFLAAVHPSLAVIEVGAHNRYGHPGQDALQRLHSAGARILRTDEHSTITVNYDEQGVLQVATER